MDEPKIKPLKNIANVLGRIDVCARKRGKIEEVSTLEFDIDRHEAVLSRNEISKMNNETLPKIEEPLKADAECRVENNVGGNSVISRVSEKDNAEMLPIDLVSTDKVMCNISVMKSVSPSDEEKSVQIDTVSKSSPLKCNIREIAYSENTFASMKESLQDNIRSDFSANDNSLFKIKTSGTEEIDAVNSTSTLVSFSRMIENDEKKAVKSEIELDISPVKMEGKSLNLFSEWTKQFKSPTREICAVPSVCNDTSSNKSCEYSSTPIIKRCVNLKDIKAKKIDFMANERTHGTDFIENDAKFPKEEFGNDISSAVIENATFSTPEKYLCTFPNSNPESMSFKLKRQASPADFHGVKKKKFDISRQKTISEICLNDENIFEIQNTLSNCDDICWEKGCFVTNCNEITKNQGKEKSIVEVQHFDKELKIIGNDNRPKKDKITFVDDDRNANVDLETDQRHEGGLFGQRKILEIDLTDEIKLEMQNSFLKCNENCKENKNVNTISNNKIVNNQEEEEKLVGEVQNTNVVELNMVKGNDKQELKMQNASFMICDDSKKNDKIFEFDNVNKLKSARSDKANISAQRKIEEIDLTDEIICDNQTTVGIYDCKKHAGVYNVCNSNIAEGEENKLAIETQHVDKLKVIEGSSKKELKKEPVLFVSDDPEENNDNNNPEWTILQKLQNDEERYKTVRERWRNLIIPDPNKNLTCIHSRYFKHPIQSSNAKRNDNTRNVHKRTFSHEPTTSSVHEHVKRARTRSCTTSYDIKVQNYYKEMEKKSRKLSAEKRHALANTDDFYNRQLSYLMASELRHYNYWEFQHRIAKLKAQRKEAEEAVHKDFAGAFDRLENEKRRQVSVFMKAMKEVEAFHKFYRKLDEESSSNDCFFLTDIELEDVMETDMLYEKFNTFYS